jgi:hypothetical protein
LRILDHTRKTHGDDETRVDIVDIDGEMSKEDSDHMRFKKTCITTVHSRLSLGGVFFSLFLALMMTPHSAAGRFY